MFSSIFKSNEKNWSFTDPMFNNHPVAVLVAVTTLMANYSKVVLILLHKCHPRPPKKPAAIHLQLGLQIQIQIQIIPRLRSLEPAAMSTLLVVKLVQLESHSELGAM